MSEYRLGEEDAYLLHEGTHFRLHERLGAHLAPDGVGCFFGVWAPNAASVSVIGDFNDWAPSKSPLELDERTGVWHGFVSDVSRGSLYKYRVRSRQDDYEVDKTDPFAFYREEPPLTASTVWDLGYQWNDATWMAKRKKNNALDSPWSVYEMHLGSWRRSKGHTGEPLGYRELARELSAYAVEMGFTHVELLPVMEHPYYPSWGYQVTGYFAPSSRYGTPQDFMYLVDELHRHGIGVILDWVPSHFPSDAHGLSFFDGTYLFEHADPKRRVHPDWDSLEFNYGRGGVSSFLLSSAHFWLEYYHADALRVDAVASMLYLDYSRDEGGWSPNRYGGRENLEAIEILRRLNVSVYERYPDVQTIAEESTSWPMVSRPTHLGGLGFGMKWDMGFMHDTLAYMKEAPRYRAHHQDKLTFRAMYAHSENFTLPLSHDEVVHGKGSLLTRMPGEDWEQFANLRLLFAYMWAQPGKKLLFMGGEFGQRREWTHDEPLEWFVLQYPLHLGVADWVRDLNRFYLDSPALYDKDYEGAGFQWVKCDNDGTSVISFLRFGRGETAPVLAVFNFSDTIRRDFRIGVPSAGRWVEQLNSDSAHYGGRGEGNLGSKKAEKTAADGFEHSLALTLPGLGAVFFTPAPSRRVRQATTGKRTPKKKRK